MFLFLSSFSLIAHSKAAIFLLLGYCSLSFTLFCVCLYYPECSFEKRLTCRQPACLETLFILFHQLHIGQAPCNSLPKDLISIPTTATGVPRGREHKASCSQRIRQRIDIERCQLSTMTLRILKKKTTLSIVITVTVTKSALKPRP
jgi:hypothetical protein